MAFYDHGSGGGGGVGVVWSSDRKKVGFGLRQTQWNSGCTGSLPHPFGPSCLLCKMAMVAACRVRVQDPQMGSRQTCHCRPLGRSSLHLPAGEPDNRKHVVGHPQHSYLWFPFLLTQCVRLLWRRGPTWLSGWSWLCVSASRNTPQSLRNLDQLNDAGIRQRQMGAQRRYFHLNIDDFILAYAKELCGDKG